MTIQVLPAFFKKIGLVLFLASILTPLIAGFLNPCVSNEEFNLIYPYDFLLAPAFFIGILLFFLSKKKTKQTTLTA